jgi:hypothetical protein
MARPAAQEVEQVTVVPLEIVHVSPECGYPWPPHVAALLKSPLWVEV